MAFVRIVFVFATVFFGWLSLRSEWPGIVSTLDGLAFWQPLAVLVAICCGLFASGMGWNLLLVGFGYQLPRIQAFFVLFVGQLGKYIPGSVWSVAAQGDLGRRFGLPVRTTVSGSFVFIYLHAVTAALIGSISVILGLLAVDIPRWLSVAIAITAAIGLAPRSMRLFARALAGKHASFQLTISQYLALLLLFAGVWLAFGLGLVLLSLSPAPGMEPTLPLSSAVAAFALAYLAGLVVPLAPAGFGIREALMILLITPDLGVTRAAFVALTMRVATMIADFAAAAISWLVLRKDDFLAS